VEFDVGLMHLQPQLASCTSNLTHAPPASIASIEGSHDPLAPKMDSVVKVRNRLEWQQRRKVVCLKPHTLLYASHDQLDSVSLRLLDRCSRWHLELSSSQSSVRKPASSE